MHLDGPDAHPMRYACGVGWPSERDPHDYAFVVAKDSGYAGVIEHLWMQLEHQPDSLTVLRIWIDDSLIVSDHLYSFFKKAVPALHAPFDSLCSGALVCDVQMPFKRCFRVTYSADFNHCCLFWAVGWRAVDSAAITEAWSVKPSATSQQQMAAAEKVMWNHGSPWSKESPISKQGTGTVASKDTLVLASLIGEGLIQTIHLKPSTFDTALLKNVTLEMYWDGSPKPSVQVPLLDFFGSGAGLKRMTSLPLRTDSISGLTSYFPMPFYRKALLRLINNSNTSVSVLYEILYSKESVDRNAVGYFQTEFHASLPTYDGVLHRVASTLGRGKFVGMTLSVPFAPVPYYLEGDPYFNIDSNDRYSFGYTGTEDYFNGGWFFEDGAYSLPFAGCTALWSNLYRFHFLDAMDFTKSFDLRMQHGPRNDVQINMRTVGYLYRHWTPFWVSRDTICRSTDRAFTVAGSGYKPNETITATLDTTALFTTTCNVFGEFSYNVPVKPAIPLGLHWLSVNGEQRPEPITIITKPAIRFLRDPLPETIRWTDTLIVQGSGFTPGETVYLSFDTTYSPSLSPCIVDSQYSFRCVITTPWLSNGAYHIHALGSKGTRASSDSTITVTRSLNYECEYLWPPIQADGDCGVDYMVYFDKRWSNQTYVRFQPGDINKVYKLSFQIPYSDSFHVSLFATKGSRFGKYEIAIDNNKAITFDGYEDRDFGDPIRSDAIDLGHPFLIKGYHTMTFKCIGKQHDEYLFGADNFVLDPLSTFVPQPLDHISEAPAVAPSLLQSSLIKVYPNPAGNLTHIQLDIPLQRDDTDVQIQFKLRDLLGRTVLNAELQPNRYITRYTKDLDLSALPAGAYFLTISTTGSKTNESISRLLIH